MLRSPWTTWTHGRRCALIGASAAVVCLGGVLAACGGGGGGDGYVATGAAGGPPRVSGTAVAPTGEVTLVPLDEPTSGEGSDLGGTGSGNARGRYGSQAPASPERTARAAPRPSQALGPTATPTATDSSAPPRSSPAPSAPPSPAAPAQLTVSEPAREPTEQRWCEKVTVAFHNSGGTAVRSGTVTFGTHIIGALGIDWATVESTHELPAPIGAGAREERTWTVCVEAWRVPLGMHIETRDVSVRWEQ
ncbi:hypothetical protein J7F01_36275 [Streptomyces sp. ISL-22]|uniref:hypothetical protein n=1 Tax=unclassified Streptomyces TaxID=2593676 RepID=UPI001BE7A9EB|nr:MULTISPECIES: hypothetical protein [unclassified Streptomyces]MBT2423878.1 hypothetical protein [Streptomyces sp. ISL-24]MBT2437514.1 hypothetical protein [Streptomyces sp. ISL-22]